MGVSRESDWSRPNSPEATAAEVEDYGAVTVTLVAFTFTVNPRALVVVSGSPP